MYINCLREDHKDDNASAILNDGSGRYVNGSVKCMGCGMWYMEDTSNIIHSSYEELLASQGKDIKLSKIEIGGILPYSKVVTPKSYFKSHPKKSRKNYNGRTVKSNLKSDRNIVVNEKIVYIDKTPRVLNDSEGTHESVKEFFFNEEISDTGFIDTSRGFYNRISIDSDDEKDILPRLKSIIEHASINGFWFILNNGNNRFQANINLYHTVLNGHDLTKVKEIAKCLNNLAGDEHMTNSFMKNHKVYTDREPKELHMGAQKTRTYGFDINLQKDFEDYVNNVNSFNWDTKWMKMVQDSKINISFIDSITGIESLPNKDSICVILPERTTEFNIRKDKTWSVSVESLWINTVVKYAQQKTEDGTIQYTGIEHGKVSQTNITTFHLISSILKDNSKTTYNDNILKLNVKANVDKYVDYYKDSMKVYNPEVFEISNDIRYAGEFTFLRYLMENKEDLLSLIVLIRAASQNGHISTSKVNGMNSNWPKIYQNSLMAGMKNMMSNMSSDEIEVFRLLVPVLTKISTSVELDLYKGVNFNSLPKYVKPYYSIAVEATYYNKPSIVTGVSKKIEDALLVLARMDYSTYKNISVDFLMGSMIENEDNKFLSKVKYLDRMMEINEEMTSIIMSKTGMFRKLEALKVLYLGCRVDILDSYYSSPMIARDSNRKDCASLESHKEFHIFFKINKRLDKKLCNRVYSRRAREKIP